MTVPRDTGSRGTGERGERQLLTELTESIDSGLSGDGGLSGDEGLSGDATRVAAACSLVVDRLAAAGESTLDGDGGLAGDGGLTLTVVGDAWLSTLSGLSVESSSTSRSPSPVSLASSIAVGWSVFPDTALTMPKAPAARAAVAAAAVTVRQLVRCCIGSCFSCGGGGASSGVATHRAPRT